MCVSLGTGAWPHYLLPDQAIPNIVKNLSTKKDRSAQTVRTQTGSPKGELTNLDNSRARASCACSR